MRIIPAQASPTDVQRILVGAVVPRPIAFVSTISPDGVLNLAPFSFFNAVCTDPPVICVAISRPPAGDPRTHKDTLANIEAIGEFVVNIVAEPIAEQMNLTSGHYPSDVDEFSLSRLTPVKSDLVKPPRVGESPVAFECKSIHNILVSDRKGGSNLILGEVVCIHIADFVVDEKNRIDPVRLRAVGRMGGISYVRTSDLFEYIRPK